MTGFEEYKKNGKNRSMNYGMLNQKGKVDGIGR